MSMKIEEVYQYFTNPPVVYLNHQQAVCYVLSVLLEGESYATGLIERLESEYPNYQLGDTVLFGAIRFLLGEGAITAYWKKVVGRGRPRKMYQLTREWREEAKRLADFWVSCTV